MRPRSGNWIEWRSDASEEYRQFDGVREHPAFPVVQGAFLTVLFGIAYLTNGHVVVAGFAALSGVGFLVERYNYRFGTSHIRLDA